MTIPDGRRKTVYRRTEKEVMAKAREARKSIELGIVNLDKRQTLASYLTSWLDDTA